MEKYTTPDMELIEIETEDIIMTSGGNYTDIGGGENELPFTPRH